MKASDAFKRGMRDVADAVKHVAHEAEQGGGAGSHIHVARRTNIKVARNIGQDGGTAHAFASQEAPIVQDGATTEGTDNSRS
jgi:hypothetical protein